MSGNSIFQSSTINEDVRQWVGGEITGFRYLDRVWLQANLRAMADVDARLAQRLGRRTMLQQGSPSADPR